MNSPDFGTELLGGALGFLFLIVLISVFAPQHGDTNESSYSNVQVLQHD